MERIRRAARVMPWFGARAASAQIAAENLR
jgi:hypothetical protein